MNVSGAFISGIVQGLTEFFPVSSSGHLVLLHALLKISTPQLAFDIFLHLGTLLAVLIYFRKDVVALFTTEKRRGLLVLMGTVPAAAVGILAKSAIERFFAMPKAVSAMMVVTGAWLALCSLLQRRHERAGYRTIVNVRNCLLIGLAQAVAIVPGISRSGATIATAVGLGVDREEAFSFSFLLSLPAITGASLLKLPEACSGFSFHEGTNFICGGITAALIGLFALRILSKAVKSNRLYLFGIYCAAIGLAGISFFR